MCKYDFSSDCSAHHKIGPFQNQAATDVMCCMAPPPFLGNHASSLRSRPFIYRRVQKLAVFTLPSEEHTRKQWLTVRIIIIIILSYTHTDARWRALVLGPALGKSACQLFVLVCLT